jgi:hypothetical protein
MRLRFMPNVLSVPPTMKRVVQATKDNANSELDTGYGVSVCIGLQLSYIAYCRNDLTNLDSLSLHGAYGKVSFRVPVEQ